MSASRPYRLGKRAEAAQRLRRRILDAAGELIAEAGFHPVSVDEIAARAGASRPSVYRHFGSKRGVLEAVAWDMVGRAGIERLDAARALPDPVEALDTFLRENCRLFASLADALWATLLAARDEPEVAHIVELTYHGRRVESLAHLAGRLEAEGALAPGWTRDSALDALIALTSVEPFVSLTGPRGRTAEEAADVIVALAASLTKVR